MEVREQAVTRNETGVESVTMIIGAGVDAVRESRRETDFEDTLTLPFQNLIMLRWIQS